MTAKPAAVYARLSNKQDANEPTVEYQVRKCQEYLERKGYTISADAIYQEGKGHHSGRHLSQRKAMQQLLVELPRYNAVAFHDFSRFSRSVEFAFDFVNLAAKHKVVLYDVAADDEITIANANDYIRTGMKAMFAEYESVAASDRQKRAYARAKENGWVYRRVSTFGLKLVGSRGDRHLERADNPGEFNAAVEVITLRSKGFAPREIAIQMRLRGFKARTRSGAPTDFQIYHIRDIDDNLELYRGFVDAKLIDQAISRIEKRKSKRGPAIPRKHPPLMLRDLLVCDACGRKFYSSYHKPRPGEDSYYPIYIHPGEYICDRRGGIVVSELHARVFDLLTRFVDHLERNGDSIYRQIAEAQRKPVANDKEMRRKELLGKLRTVKERLFNNPELADWAAELKQQIESELAELEELGRREVALRTLSFGEIRALMKVTTNWELLYKANPREFNLMLHDLFAEVRLTHEGDLKFVPHESAAEYWRGII